MATAAAAAAPVLAPARRRLSPDPAPSRAGGVQLLGELAGSGYRETPTLVRRGDGQIVKLTSLLYELVEGIDGRRGHEELADELGRRVGRQVAADDVRFLVERKLQPLGLVQRPDGVDTELRKANPLLALRLRVIVSNPALTRRLTAPFLWLFSPWVVMPMLLAFGAVSGWLLFEKGLSSALHQAFYAPGLILAIWGLVLVSAAFHEIGHATACRYGGAEPGVMGAGLYLIRPAFYTEVSDSYRLSRAARLRVDLGGLYFSAVFAVATAALWLLTGVDALLLVIAVQLVQMVQQLVPFIRADGYHIVADLIGVPDLFAHIKPTLLGVLPKRWRRAEARALKPWARAVVVAWVLLTVPVLAGLLVMLVVTFPRLAGTAGDSMGMRWAEAATLWAEADVAGLVVTVVSLGLIALPVLSIVYLVGFLARRTALRAWRDTAGRPRMRVAALLTGAAVVALVGSAWWPDESYRPIDERERGLVPTVFAPAPLPQPKPTVRAMQLVPARASGLVLQQPLARVFGVAPLQLERGIAPRRRLAVAKGAPTVAGLTTLPVGTRLVAAPAPVKKPAARGRAQAPTGPSASPPAPQAPDRADWPFPFDPPAAAAAGDNRAMAVNTVDGSMLWDFALDLQVLVGGEPVRQANEAHAYANCVGCVTGAVAFQVLLIVGQADEIVPLNAGVAANYRCVLCRTHAFAFQIVASVLEAPDPAIQEELDAIMRRLGELEANAGSLSAEEVLRALVQARQDFLLALEPILAGETGSTDVEGTEDSDEGTADPSSGDGTTRSDGGGDEDDGAAPEQEGDRSAARDEDVSEPGSGAPADREGDATAPNQDIAVDEPIREPTEGGAPAGGTEDAPSIEPATTPQECGPEAEEASAERCPEDAELSDGGELAEELSAP